MLRAASIPATSAIGSDAGSRLDQPSRGIELDDADAALALDFGDDALPLSVLEDGFRVGLRQRLRRT
jgi:hypothetical protein